VASHHSAKAFFYELIAVPHIRWMKPYRRSTRLEWTTNGRRRDSRSRIAPNEYVRFTTWTQSKPNAVRRLWFSAPKDFRSFIRLQGP